MYHLIVDNTFEEEGNVFRAKVWRDDQNNVFRAEVALYKKYRILKIFPTKSRKTPWMELRDVEQDKLPEAIEHLKDKCTDWYTDQKKIESWSSLSPNPKSP